MVLSITGPIISCLPADSENCFIICYIEDGRIDQFPAGYTLILILLVWNRYAVCLLGVRDHLDLLPVSTTFLVCHEVT